MLLLLDVVVVVVVVVNVANCGLASPGMSAYCDGGKSDIVIVAVIVKFSIQCCVDIFFYKNHKLSVLPCNSGGTSE
jgi:hypothetical protein